MFLIAVMYIAAITVLGIFISLVYGDFNLLVECIEFYSKPYVSIVAVFLGFDYFEKRFNKKLKP